MKPLGQIAERIKEHLKRANEDPDNKLHGARAYASGRWVYVIYVSYQGRSHLTKTDAEAYLRWLDANPDTFKRHHSALRTFEQEIR